MFLEQVEIPWRHEGEAVNYMCPHSSMLLFFFNLKLLKVLHVSLFLPLPSPTLFPPTPPPPQAFTTHIA